MITEKRLTEKKTAVRLAACLAALVILLFCAAELFGASYFCTEQPLCESPVGEITAHSPVLQELSLSAEYIDCFELCFGTYGRVNDASVTVELLDSAGGTVFAETFLVSSLADNAYRAFRLSSPLALSGEGFSLRISSDAEAGEGVTLWRSSSDRMEGSLSYGDETVNADLALRLYHGGAKGFATVLPWLCALLLILVPLAVFLLRFCERTKAFCEKHPWADAALTVLIGALFSFLAVFFAALLYVKAVGSSVLFAPLSLLAYVFSPVNAVRALVLLPLGVLAFAILFYGARRVSDFVFEKRWLITLSVLGLWVLCKVNFSNVSIYNGIIQPHLGDGLMSPLFGQTRPIRSDEWLVDMAQAVSTKFAGYGRFNEILRGTSNYNLAATGLYFSLAALAEPFNFGFYLFGTEYGVSLFWCAAMLFGIALSFEFGYIISDKSRVGGLLGIALIALSPFHLWWSVCDLIVGALGFLVCAYYCVHAKRFLHRCLLLASAAFSALYFVAQLYPAWQVPFVYIIIALFAWIAIENFDRLKAFCRRDWIAVGVAVAAFGVILLAYVLEIREYSASVLSTVYPGERFETGGYALRKNFSFIESFLLPFKDITAGSNNSEASTFFSLYPLPTLIAVYVLIRQLAAKKKDSTQRLDVFNIALLIPTLFLTVYCTVGIPAWLSKITLMSYSPAFRATDFLAFANTLLLIRNTSRLNRYRLRLPVCAVAVGAVLLFSLREAEKMCPSYMTVLYAVLIFATALAFGVACFSRLPEKLRSGILVGFCAIAIGVGCFVSPMNAGIGALTEKPVALKLQEISQNDPEAKWIGYDSIILGQYAVANGAPCITSVNYVPNMALWQTLDPDGVYNEVYNRYAHVVLKFTEGETVFTLLTPDSMQLELSYGDIAKTGVKYILSQKLIEENSSLVDLALLYAEDGAYIYEILFLK